jgi:hypothetical protein
VRIEANNGQRPDTAGTTSTTLVLRTGVEAGRVSEAMRLPLGANFHKIELISQAHARTLLDERKTEVTIDLECWIAGHIAAAHENGYKAVNLENTMSWTAGNGSTKIGIKKMYLHHLALIGADRRDELGWCTQAGTFHVSHLCHNNGCFNPAHLVVEEANRNKDRNSCQGHSIVEYSGNGALSYHPCRHGGERNMYRRCILANTSTRAEVLGGAAMNF